MKQRHALYLSAPVSARLEAAAREARLSKSAIMEQALDRFLGGTGDIGNGGQLALAQLSTQKELAAIRREIAAATEISAVFIRYFLTVTPPLPTLEQDAARALGRKRFDAMLEQVARRLAGDGTLIDEVDAKLQKGDQHTGDRDDGQKQ